MAVVSGIWLLLVLTLLAWRRESVFVMDNVRGRFVAVDDTDETMDEDLEL